MVQSRSLGPSCQWPSWCCRRRSRCTSPAYWRSDQPAWEAARRGVYEELGSVVGAGDVVVAGEGDVEAWTEDEPSKSFPGAPAT